MEQPVDLTTPMFDFSFSKAEVKLIYRVVRAYQQDVLRRMSDDTQLVEPDITALEREDRTCDFILAAFEDRSDELALS